ncbi:MAG: 2,3,4,5-tetrahydropyridine-2,6-dicarboxylate N-succinyltransferase [Alphaproteobacteria bacterium]
MKDTTYNINIKEKTINELWDNRNNIVKTPEIEILINEIIHLLEIGILRVTEKKNGSWYVNEWVKKTILLFFKFKDMHLISGGPSKNSNITYWYDKIESKFQDWGIEEHKEASFRSVPGCIVRESAYIGKNVVLMPCFVNVGAYIDEGTMVDTWSTIGSCAQIGKNCHISGGVGIGGVLEPLQANPVIIEDNCFIGARSEIAEGVIVKEGAVIAMGVYISASTKIIDRDTGNISYGIVPPYSVIVPGNYISNNSNISTYAAIIIKKVDEKTRSKTSINELLRS